MTGKDESTETVADVLSDIDIAWTRLQSAVQSIPADRADEPGVCGVWSAKIVVGHVAFWNAFESVRLRKEGKLGEVDWQALNDTNASETAGREFTSVCSELVASHDLVMAAIADTPTLEPKHVRELVFDHYVEHTAEIERWVKTL